MRCLQANNFTAILQAGGAGNSLAAHVGQLMCQNLDLVALHFQWTTLAIDNTFLLFSAYLVFAMQRCLLLPLRVRVRVGRGLQ